MKVFTEAASSIGVPISPLSPPALIKVVRFLLQKRVPSTVIGIVQTVFTLFKEADIPVPSESQHIKLMMKGLAVRARIKVRKAYPLTADIVKAILYLRDDMSPYFALRMAVVALGFFLWTRVSELVSLQTTSFSPHPSNQNFEVVSIWSKKTNSCDDIVIPLRGPNRLIPSFWVNAFRSRALAFSEPLLQQLNSQGIAKGTALTRSDVTSLLKDAVMVAGFPEIAPKITTHSSRRGGTTSAAIASQPSIRIQRHGRWRSGAYQGYIDEALELNAGVAISLLNDLRGWCFHMQFSF